MSHPLIEECQQDMLRADLPAFAPGDTVNVTVKVKEGERERMQSFQGVVIAIKNRGINSSFTVRKMSHGEGVERVFQTHSPTIGGVEIVRRGKVRQSKIYYLRELKGRAARIPEKLAKRKTEGKAKVKDKEVKETKEEE